MPDFDPARLDRIEDWMRSYVDAGKFPGSTLLLAKDGEIAHRASCGWRAVADRKPFEEDTIVRIFSMTKPVTSAALMTLVERGLFHLDAPVSEFLPEFADCEALIPGAERLDQTAPCPCPTVHQLATHTSGLTYSFNPGLVSAAYTECKLDFNADGPGLEEATKRVAALPLAFSPGARWEYSVGIDVMGRIIEVVSGKPLDRFFADEIFEPLGMDDTFFSLPDDRVSRFANLYTSLEGDPMALGTKSDKITMREVDQAETSPYRATSTFSGGGGLLAPIDDYFQFAEMLRKGGEHNGARILSPSTVRFMRRNHLKGDIASMGPKSFAEMPMDGIGFGIGGSVVIDPARCRMPGNVGDFSWGGMASTIFWIDEVTGVTCVFFTQLTPSSSYPNRPQLKALVHGALTA
ncbi:MAG: serine hydrolase domain-containing protein [Pseudomonadota bacterium]